MFTQGPLAARRCVVVPSEPFVIGNATVNLVTTPTAAPEVEVLYSGTQPPMALFGHLGAMGFVGLVPVPPPADAIDWQTPDPTSGRAFSVRPFPGRALGRLDATTTQRDRALDATRYLLGRLAGSDAPPPHLATDVAPNGDGNGDGHPTATSDGAAAVGAVVSARQDGADAFTLPPAAPTAAPPASSSVVVLEVVLDELVADRARLALGGLARVNDERVITWTTEQTYRGSTTVTNHRAARLLVEVAAGDVDAVRSTLAPYRPRSIGIPVRT
jgi:hypothetical protein